MRRLCFFFIFFHLSFSAALSQRITRQYNDVSLSKALLELSREQTNYTISFIYNELEDFRITTNIKNMKLPDAIQQMIGFYPVRMTVKSEENEIFVECTHKTDRHLTGSIIDEQGEPVAYANIAILNPADSTLLSGGVSNESGYFAIPYEREQILARISYVGYKTVCLLCDKEDIGTIQMQPETYTIQGVVVEGQRPVLRRKAGAIVFDTRHITGAINAKDLLPYAPGIIIDNDNISLFGAGGIILCINGKEQKLQARDMLQLLQSYPASDVERIEISPSPGAGYSAEGNAGFVNIVLKKHESDFIGGSVTYARTQYEKHGDEANAGIIYNKGRISTSLNLAGIGDHTVFRETNTIDFPDTRRLDTDNGHISKENYTLRWQLDCQASSRLNLGTYVMYADGERHLDIDGLYDYLPASPGSLCSLNTLTRRKENTKTWAVNVNAVQELPSYAGVGSIHYNLDHYRIRMDDGRHSMSYVTFVGNSPDVVLHSDTANFDYHNNIAQVVDNYSAKVDVCYAEFKLGSQYVYTRSHLDLDYSGTGEAYNHVSTIYGEQVLAGYAEYSRTFGSAWSMNIGGRYEHTWTKGENRPVDYDIHGNYGKFFPSLQVGFHPNRSHTFNWSLSNRITRPNIISLNPNCVWKDVNHVSYGNQKLTPSYMYKAMMGYTYKDVLNFDLYYVYEPDRVDVVYGVNEQVTYSSWDNITDEHTLGINSFCYFDKLRWMTATLIQGIEYSKTIRLPKEIVHGIIRPNLYSKVQSISYTGHLQTSFFFDRNHRWVANLNATYSSPEKDVTRKLDARYMVDVGVLCRLWRDRLTVGLTCRNLFSSHIKGTEYLGATKMTFDNKFNYRKILLTLTYHRGARLRHHQHRYESDEMQERMVNDF